MDERDDLAELGAELAEIAAKVDEEMAAGKYGPEQYDRIHRLEDATAKYVEGVDRWTRETMADMRRRLTDLEAERFADSIERDIDLAKWNGGLAAFVGHQLEDVADKIMDAITASRRGEDVAAQLFGIHMDVAGVIGYLLADEEEDE